MENLHEKVGMFLRLCGSEFTVTTKGKTIVSHAVIQPLRYKNKLYVEFQPSEVGRTDDGCYLYLGAADTVFATDDRLEFSSKKFVVERFEPVYLFGKPIYNWAVLRPCVTSEV